MKRSSWLAASLACLFLCGCGGESASRARPAQADAPPPLVIGFSIGGFRIERWKRDEQILQRRAAELGASIITLSANENPELQNSHIENFAIQRVDVLIVMPHDGEKAGQAVQFARKAGIPVVAYDRLLLNCPLDFYVSFDNEKVGEYQARDVVDALPGDRPLRLAYLGGAPTDANAFALKNGAMRVLAPLIDSGRASLALDVFIPNWSPQEAYAAISAFLDAGGQLDGIVAANDGLAGGAVQALRERGLAGLPISGQDAELAACRRIVEGSQTLTVYKPLDHLGTAAIEIAASLARGQIPSANAAVHNGHGNIPAILLESIPVDRNNLLDTVVRDGFHSRDAIFANTPGTAR